MSIVDELLERREVHDLIRDFSKELLERRKDRKELLSKLDDITFYLRVLSENREREGDKNGGRVKSSPKSKMATNNKQSFRKRLFP